MHVWSIVLSRLISTISNTILCANTLIVNDGLTPLRGRRRSGADVRIEESFIKQSHRSFLTKVNKYDTGKYKTFIIH